MVQKILEKESKSRTGVLLRVSTNRTRPSQPSFLFHYYLLLTLFTPHIEKNGDLYCPFRIFDQCEELKLICYEKVCVLCIHCGLFYQIFFQIPSKCLCILSHFLIIMLKSKSAHPAFLNDKLATARSVFFVHNDTFSLFGYHKNIRQLHPGLG